MGINASEVLRDLCNIEQRQWRFKATGFVGYDDADPSNVSELFRGAGLATVLLVFMIWPEGEHMSQKTTNSTLVQKGLSSADVFWPGRLDAVQKEQLSALIEQHGFSVAAGDLTLLNRKWYVTHSGLLRLARKNHCSGIQTEMVTQFCDPGVGRWVVKATVYKSSRSKGFVGYGDADPSNVSEVVRGAEMRIAETRAVNRALRKAYGIGLCSVEEMGAPAEGGLPDSTRGQNNGEHSQPARLRDQLLLLIRQYDLDAAQVKRFAEDFCGNKPLREAKREEIEAFLQHLTQLLSQDRERALQVLARYAIAPEGTPGDGHSEAKTQEAA